MSFSRRGRLLAEEEKSTDAAKARARAMELLAGQELSSGQLYERLGRKFTQPTAAAVVAEMVERQYVDDERYARTRAHGLLAALYALRKRLAAKQNVPAYMVFSDATLREMVQSKPLSMDEFLNITGVGEKKAARYGMAFLRAIEDMVGSRE